MAEVVRDEATLRDPGRGRQLGGEDLDRHPLPDVDVLGLVDSSHPAAPNLAREAVLFCKHGPERDFRRVGRGHQTTRKVRL